MPVHLHNQSPQWIKAPTDRINSQEDFINSSVIVSPQRVSVRTILMDWHNKGRRLSALQLWIQIQPLKQWQWLKVVVR